MKLWRDRSAEVWALQMTMKSKLEQYTGPLNSAEIAAGMNAARQNAERLAKDARLLFENERYTSSLSLAILSIEESGKNHIFRELALARNEKELRECWRDYRSHTKKNVLWPIIETFFKGARRADDFRPLVEPDAEHPYVLDKVKQVSIYTDCFKKGHWSIPEQIITKELAQGLLMVAEVFTRHRDITAEEIDLWIQYLQPYWKISDGASRRALFEWDKEIRRRGLAEKDDNGTLERFFTTGFDPADYPKP
jgi:AbiV family abortive infection protein